MVKTDFNVPRSIVLKCQAGSCKRDAANEPMRTQVSSVRFNIACSYALGLRRANFKFTQLIFP